MDLFRLENGFVSAKPLHLTVWVCGMYSCWLVVMMMMATGTLRRRSLRMDGWMGGLVLDSNIIQSSSFPPPSSLRAFELPSKIIKLQWKFFFSILWNPFPGRSVAVAGSFMSPSFFSSCRTVAVDGLGAAPATDQSQLGHCVQNTFR